MNAAHMHLILNHIPLISIPLALLFLVHSVVTKNRATERFALLVLFATAALVIPIFLTGEPAEEVVEHLPGVGESWIESHEDAAKVSLIMSLIVGALSALAIWFRKQDSADSGTRAALLVKLVLVSGVLATGSLGYTASLGGKVRHTEIRGDAAQLNSEGAGGGQSEGSEANESDSHSAGDEDSDD